MKRGFLVCAAVAVLIAAAGLFLPSAEAREGHGPPPPIAVPAPPPLMHIPGTYSYFMPDIDADIVFFRGGWYRHYRGTWFRSDRFNGRWTPVPPRRLPMVLRNLPPNWKQVPPGQPRLPHDQVLRSWQQWERERHWDRPAPQPAPRYEQPREPRHEERYEERREPRHEERYEERREPRHEDDRNEERRDPRPDQRPDHAPGDDYRDEGPGGGHP